MLEKPANVLENKVENFTNRIIKMVKYLKGKYVDSSILNQVLRSGLSIGANVSEAKFAQSRADFVHKMSIALKEANETKYWIEKLHAAEYLSEVEFSSINTDCKEVVALLVSIVNTTKKNGV